MALSRFIKETRYWKDFSFPNRNFRHVNSKMPLSIPMVSSPLPNSQKELPNIKSASSKLKTVAFDEPDYGHHEMIVLSPELNKALGTILDASSPLDTNELQVVDYMNVIFPTGRSCKA